MLLAPDEARRITAGLLLRSKAEHCIVKIDGANAANLRFARGSATTNGQRSTLKVTVETRIGRRSGSASTSELGDDELETTLRRSEDIARAAPENPEMMAPLGPQDYPAGARYDTATAAVRAADLAGVAKPIIDEAARRNVEVAGYGTAQHGFDAMASSAGLFVHERHTGAELTVTARNRMGTWSGWGGVSGTRFERLDAARVGRRAIDKAAYSATPARLDPGRYTVILEPSAVSDLVGFMLWFMNARAADEGRSFFSRTGGGNRIGEKILHEDVTIFSDPGDPIAPESIFGEDGLPRRRVDWVANGVLQNLVYPRFWAEQKGRAPVSRPHSFVMSGGTTTVDEMIRATKRGVLVTRLWYIRVVDPQMLLLTGLTRDGNFLIEEGRIAGPAINFRFNESPITVLRNVVAIGPSERTRGGEMEGTATAAPPLLVKDFNFSSVSDAI
jgi:predicted Zn-dependent protease